jgi:hypothetical protein
MLAGDVARTIHFGNGVTTPTDQVFKIGLRPGWNLIGNPFAFTIPGHALMLASQTVDLRSFEGGEWKSDVMSLKPYEGYAVWNRLNTVDSLVIDPSVRGEAPVETRPLVEHDPDEIRERLLKSTVPPSTLQANDWGGPGGQWTVESVFPNPSSGDVSIVYSVPRLSKGTVSVFDLLGRRVATLVDNRRHGAGRFVVRWRPGREDGGSVSGVYFVQTSTAGRNGSSLPLTIVR